LDELELASKLCSSPQELGFFYTLYLGGLGGGTMAESVVESFAVFCRLWYHKLTARHNSTKISSSASATFSMRSSKAMGTYQKA
jgi:hypothetical protein